MANSKRRYMDSNGNMFIPMNMEGGSWNENFMTTPKLVTLGISLAVGAIMIAWLRSNYAETRAYVILISLYIFVLQIIVRYIIFEERFYYRMYKKLKESEVTTPAIFWDIAYIKEVGDASLLTYTDGKVGIIVRLERDTIIGKDKRFTEDHYDAISDFYKELSTMNYSFVQMNVMEQAGNDPRLTELDKLLTKSDNPNICKLMERQIGYIKGITNKTLYESDYILVYTKDPSKVDAIVNDTIESVYKILDGAFIGFRILRTRDIIELVKEGYGVKYFNYTEATLSIFKNSNIGGEKTFDLSEIIYSDGERQKVGDRELNIINRLTSGDLNGTMDISKVSIKDALFRVDDRYEFTGIDFESLSDVFNENVNIGNESRVTAGEKNDMGGNGNSQGNKNEGNLEVEDLGRRKKKAIRRNRDSGGRKNQLKIDKKVELFNEFSDDDETIDF